MSAWFEAPAHLMLVLAAVVSGQEPAAQSLVPATSVRPAEQGPYAFSEQEWLSAVQRGLGGSAIEPYRRRIFATSNGRLYVPVAAERVAVLRVRQDERAARAVALDLARHNSTELRLRLGRAAGVKDLYAAHLAGIDLAVRLAGLNATNPKAVVAIALPELAADFPQLLAAGGATTVADVYRVFPDAPGGGMANTTPNEPDMMGLQIAAPATDVVDRAAPLRGVLKGPVIADAVSDKIASLEWTAEVRPAR